jgi:hypothetical protein
VRRQLLRATPAADRLTDDQVTAITFGTLIVAGALSAFLLTRQLRDEDTGEGEASTDGGD